MKNVKLIILILAIPFLLCGCGSTDLTMKIDNDGILYLSHTILVDKDEFDNMVQIYNIDENNVLYNNYTAERITEGDLEGYVVTKSFGRLSELGKNKNQPVNLSEYNNSDFKSYDLFYVRNGIIRNKYVANFNIDLTNVDDFTSNIPLLSSSYLGEDYDDALNIYEINMLSNGVSATFKLDSSFAVGDNNADKFEDGYYIWNLEYGKVNEIKFDIYYNNYGTIITILSLLVISIICVIVVYTRNNKIQKYNRTNIKESLDLEYKIVKRGEYRDIRLKNKNSGSNTTISDDVDLINERISGLGSHSNLTNSDQKTDNKIEVKPYSEQIDPEFKMITKEKILESRNKKFADEAGKRKEEKTKFIEDFLNEDKKE